MNEKERVRKVVGVERFELPTSCSQSRRATRLRYTPKSRMIIHDRLREGAIILGRWSLVKRHASPLL